MLTHSVSLYFAAVFIWGSTWYAIKFQLGTVPPELSVAYRFAIAAVILFAWCLLRGLPMRFNRGQHLWMALQGLMLFCLNYLIFYWATAELTSGLIAVIFSTIVLMNIVNSALFFRKPIDASMVAGAVIGLLGIALVFWPEIANLRQSDGAVKGLVLSILGTFIASLGNMISARNQRQRLPVIQGNAFGMAYGAVILFLFAAGQGLPFVYENTLSYNLSILYLALFGSVLAFGSYLTLLGRIGPEKAAYATVLFPLVALGISTLFEGYQWSVLAASGVALVVMGNVLVIMPKQMALRSLMFFRARYAKDH
ncbi:DMT family transporter [Sedimenticola selenatireducens]|uniref:EamA family transporter n=1 Tax=Sedimenticola selenatireducens TaxID=191960 RepID=A0A557SK47_9GAMM|nr:EamA family transporter [Sedimenticola selenatireducens]TVO77807.1 EamA family transporter [Sedimenticola selenatireducens]TVT65112.1 MAG: EamA family transporter [Sedimenticola selenatireducens]